MRKVLLLAILFSASMSGSFAQGSDDMMKMLDEGSENKKEEVDYTFKTTRLINGSTTESLGAGVMDMRISHRFGRVNEGISNFFGIDNANTRIGLDYGLTKRIMFGLGHNVLDKENDGFVKIKLLRQMKNGTPVTLSYYGGVSLQTKVAPALPSPEYKFYLSNRFCYFNQLLIARKFNDKLSLMLMPSLLHINLVDKTSYDNNIFALGVGGRMKLSKRIAFTGEYYYRFSGADNMVNGQKTYNSLSLGVDIETGGHVFQLHITNSAGVSERIMLGQTTDSWADGNIRYGFNISRVFTIIKPKEFRKK